LFDCDGEKKKKGQTKLNDIPAIFIWKKTIYNFKYVNWVCVKFYHHNQTISAAHQFQNAIEKSVLQMVILHINNLLLNIKVPARFKWYFVLYLTKQKVNTTNFFTVTSFPKPQIGIH
jgi:hypothetical protein